MKTAGPTRLSDAPRRPDFVKRKDQPEWSRRVAVICFVVAALSLFAANPALTAAGVLVLPILFVLLWRVGEPPSLLFAAAFQWTQVFVPILQGNIHGEVVGSDIGPEVETAAWLGLATIVTLAVGMRLGRGKRPIASRAELQSRANELSPSRLLVAYGLTLGLPSVGVAVSGIVPGLRQAFIGLSLFRLMVAFLAFWAATTEVRFRKIALAILFCEIVLGFGGFFSTFKTILFLATIVLLGNHVRSRLVLRPAVVLLTLCLILTTYWQAIKIDYRAFLNQGTRMQTVLVSPADRAAFLVRRTLDLTWDEMVDGFDRGIDRLGYLQFFGLTIRYVPAQVPHQYGRLWTGAVVHVLTPRLLFPGKPPLSDSARTIEFTGVRVATEEEGTSISIGYAAESYVDFGPALMFLPIFLLGAFWGWAYYWLATRSPNGLLGLSAATTLLLGEAVLFGASNIKLLGGSLTNLIVLGGLLTFWTQPLWRLLTGSRPLPRRPTVLVR